jgi:hypothetical protein
LSVGRIASATARMTEVEFAPKQISSGEGAFRNEAMRRRAAAIVASTARDRG